MSTHRMKQTHIQCHTTVNCYITVMSCDAIYRMHHTTLLASYQLLLMIMTTICCQICLLRAHYCVLGLLHFMKSCTVFKSVALYQYLKMQTQLGTESGLNDFKYVVNEH